MTSTADRYLTFLGTPYITDDGSRAQPAKGRFIEHLRAIHAEQKPKFDLTACLAGKQDGFSGQVYFWSDLHLGHQNIIKWLFAI